MPWSATGGGSVPEGVELGPAVGDGIVGPGIVQKHLFGIGSGPPTCAYLPPNRMIAPSDWIIGHRVASARRGYRP